MAIDEVLSTSLEPRRSGALAGCCLVALLGVLAAAAAPMAAFAGPRESAKRIHDRLAGVPPSAPVLTEMERLVGLGDVLGAADLAMLNPAFYNTTLKDFATPWTNRDQSIHGDLNDYSATVIGMIRDDVPFTEVLSSDLVYVGAAGVVTSAYSHTDNDHYVELESSRVDLSDPALLVPETQSGQSGSQLSPSDTAGVLTTRSAGAAFLSAGTNRRMIRFASMNYLCRDMEELHDISRANDRIRQDVSRSPGGDSAVFHNQCSGCHTGMDPLAQAFAYFDFDETAGRVVHTPGQVQQKYLINSGNFTPGYVTIDNRWDNLWREGPNAYLGWRGSTSYGYGPKSFGTEIAASRAFSICQVEKVYRKVCLRTASDDPERLEVERIADVFETENYSMKRVFAEVAASCAVQ